MGTLARPPPRGFRKTPKTLKVKSAWEALPTQIVDTHCKFGGRKKGLKVTFTDGDVLEVPASELGPSCDDDSWKTWMYAGGPPGHCNRIWQGILSESPHAAPAAIRTSSTKREGQEEARSLC